MWFYKKEKKIYTICTVCTKFRLFFKTSHVLPPPWFLLEPWIIYDIWWLVVRAVTTGFVGSDQLEASLVGAEIVVIPAGVPRKPGMTR